jgi:hypothetical protein
MLKWNSDLQGDHSKYRGLALILDFENDCFFSLNLALKLNGNVNFVGLFGRLN